MDELVVLGIGDQQGVLVVGGPQLLDLLGQLSMDLGTGGRIRQVCVLQIGRRRFGR